MLLKIYTKKYIEELRAFVKESNLEDHIHKEELSDHEDAYYYIELKNLKNRCLTVCSLLEEAILMKNAVTKNNKIVKKSVRDKVFKPFREDIREEASRYLLENDFLNIEGYINFKLKEYVNLVDLVLYSAIKRYLL